MRKFLTIFCVLISFFCKAQIIQYLGSPTTQIYVRGQLRIDTVMYLPIRDTNFTPAQKGAVVTRNADNSMYLWDGIGWNRLAVGSTAWGTITGLLSNQADLVDTLTHFQRTITAGYGIKKTGNTLFFDTAVARKVDTVFRVNDSTIRYAINGHTYDILVRGTAAGGISALSLALPSALFNTPVTFVNTAGVWTGTATFANQNPGTVFAGPASGSAAVPTFRSLAISDLPTGIPNAFLQNSFIAFSTGTSGTDVNWASNPVALGASATLNIPNASGSARGLLTPSIYNTFFNKVDSTTISNDSVYDWHNGVANFRYLIITASAGLTSLNGLTDPTQTFANSTTGSDFSITSSGTTHTFNLPLASASTTGKLSSTDWNTFNNKQTSPSRFGLEDNTGSAGSREFDFLNNDFSIFNIGVGTIQATNIGGNSSEMVVVDTIARFDVQWSTFIANLKLTPRTLVFQNDETPLANNGDVLTLLDNTQGTYGPRPAGAGKIVASADLAAQTTSTAVVSYSVPATGTYRLGGYAAITAISGNTIVVTVNWTDENGTGRSYSFLPSTGVTGYFPFSDIQIRAQSGSTMVIGATIVGAGSQTYDVGATIEKLR